MTDPQTDTTPPAAPDAGAGTTPPATPPDAGTPPAQPDTTDWKAMSRQWEARAKENKDAATKLAALEAEKLTAEQKAEAAAKAAEKRATDALMKIAEAEARAALTGVVEDPKGFVEDLNLAKFVSASGEIDSDGIAKLRDKYSKLAPGKQTPQPNPAQGANGSNPQPGQITRDQLKSMTPEQRIKAQNDGLLNDLLGIK